MPRPAGSAWGREIERLEGRPQGSSVSRVGAMTWPCQNGESERPRLATPAHVPEHPLVAAGREDVPEHRLAFVSDAGAPRPRRWRRARHARRRRTRRRRTWRSSGRREDRASRRARASCRPPSRSSSKAAAPPVPRETARRRRRRAGSSVYARFVGARGVAATSAGDNPNSLKNPSCSARSTLRAPGRVLVEHHDPVVLGGAGRRQARGPGRTRAGRGRPAPRRSESARAAASRWSARRTNGWRRIAS